MNTASFYRTIGARIKAEREQRDWKQERLAADAGIGRTSLTNIEAGNQRLLLHVFLRLAEALKVDPLTLLPPPETPSAALDQVPEQARDWVERVGRAVERKKHGKKKRVGARAKSKRSAP